MNIKLEFNSLDELEKFCANFIRGSDDKESSAWNPVTIDDLELSIRTSNCLKAEGIHTVDQLLQLSEQQLLRTPNIGNRSLKEIGGKLARAGHYLEGKD